MQFLLLKNTNRSVQNGEFCKCEKDRLQLGTTRRDDVLADHDAVIVVNIKGRRKPTHGVWKYRRACPFFQIMAEKR